MSRDLTLDISLLNNRPVDGGSHGYIFQGQMSRAKQDPVQVAVKTIKKRTPSTDGPEHQALMAEAELLRSLRHPNVIECLGSYRHAVYGIGLVFPWHAGGNVLDFLTRYPWFYRASLLEDVLLGLCYLHSRAPPIVHGDLRAANILVSAAGRACITDFGLVRRTGDEELEEDNDVRDVRWLPPECIFYDEEDRTFNDSLTPASDMYSCGMLIYEIYTEQIPFQSETTHFPLSTKIANGERPHLLGNRKAKRRGLKPPMRHLVEDCWSGRPQDRPTASEALARVKAFILQDNFKGVPRRVDPQLKVSSRETPASLSGNLLC